MNKERTNSKPPRKRKPWPNFDFWSSKHLWVGSLLSLLLTLLIHYGIGIFLNTTTFKQNNPIDEPNEFEITLEPELPEMRFVETNPEVPSNEPDKTNNFAARAQQAAQELPQNEDSPTPRLEGTREHSQAIVQSETTLPQPEPIFSEPAPQQTSTQLKQKAEAPSSKIAEFMEAQDTPLNPLGNELKKGVEESIFQAQNSTPRPRPRPSLKKLGVPAPLLQSDSGNAPLGRIAVDAEFSQFGKYQQQMLEAIVSQWHLLANRISFSAQDMNSIVVIAFTLDKEGFVHNVNVENSTASSIATMICKDAVQSRAPFGPWHPDMIQTLGDSHDIRFTFHYQ